MQREEKQLDMLLEAVLNRLNDIKHSIGTMIHRLENEYETINWPTFLDNFALISGHLTGLTKILSSEIGTPLRNLTVLPLLLTPERDEPLLQLTEGRIPVFSHDLVPDYLRTKPDPGAESRMATHEAKANNLLTETAMKQVAQYTKVISHVWDIVSKAKEEWDSEASRPGIQQTSSMADTQALVAAVGLGNGLAIVGPGGVPNSGIMIPPAIRQASPMSAVSPSGAGPLGKMPSGIKTNIKSANQVHPYR
ncbi:mediator of RNA polymerase II transcription subunit 8 [Toxorhynchites rutilus septentrionalis]|uniref:mediator of RNA polymerase II transcription subunit 8 n=1 Tax=Toxorhynchites rutilus septentrionalis TaxID=329112 RepID=UPI002479B19F|nr:mediator of RNA polymerase II transcription subunit 8 [Toxorhynchites rutilus septentrionalis]